MPDDVANIRKMMADGIFEHVSLPWFTPGPAI
jgi:hypothetical protein